VPIGTIPAHAVTPILSALRQVRLLELIDRSHAGPSIPLPSTPHPEGISGLTKLTE
jgi:hypothetical protein